MLNWLFRRKITIPSSQLENIVQGYGAVLGEASNELIRDAKSLPFPKEVIKQALRQAITITPKGIAREHLKEGYLSLADFQDMSDGERAALTTWNKTLGATPTDDLAKLQSTAKQMASVGDAHSSLRDRCMRERSALMQELARSEK